VQAPHPSANWEHMQHSIDNTTDACTRYAMVMQQAHGHVHHGDATRMHSDRDAVLVPTCPHLCLVCQWLAQPSRAGAELTQAIISAQLSSAQLSSMAPASSSQALLSTTTKFKSTIIFFILKPFSTYYNVKIAIHCCYCHCCRLSCLCRHTLLPLVPPVMLPHTTVHCCTHVTGHAAAHCCLSCCLSPVSPLSCCYCWHHH